MPETHSSGHPVSMRPSMSFSLSSSAGIRALLQVRPARGTIASVIIEAQPEYVRLPANFHSSAQSYDA